MEFFSTKVKGGFVGEEDAGNISVLQLIWT